MHVTTPFLWISLMSVILCTSCSSDDSGGQPTMPPSVTPSLAVQSVSVVEVEQGVVMKFEVKASPTNFSEQISFDYNTTGITATPNDDFTPASGTATISLGAASAIVEIEILNDNDKEIDEELRLDISAPQNATIDVGSNIGIIRDTDDSQLVDEDGYNTPSTYYGYDVLYKEEFESGIIDESIFNYELGDGCPDICGWGNNELQLYTDVPENVRVEDEKMVITATKEGTFAFNSARLTTKDKLQFRFGRVDIRAKLPKGQGLWPALWMLGANIDEVGWPACGEIDIMELVGHKPKEVLGTAHWGAPNNPSTFVSGVFSDQQDFSESFHVFTLVWEVNEINWYVDENHFHRINLSTVGNAEYRFNQDFFLIFNVAVGGLLPGPPDETTVFPQTMEIDYIRVFQLQ